MSPESSSSSSSGAPEKPPMPAGIGASPEPKETSIGPLQRVDGDEDDDANNYGLALHHTDTRHWGKLTLRPEDDEDDEDWWFASTAIPLLAATVAPLANVLSIAALVSSWRGNILDANGQVLAELDAVGYPDPHWCYALNLTSLVCGYVGNFFLLCNFTNRIKYIIALPVTIVLWYVSTAILIGITVGIHIYAPPVPPYQVYTQAFWYAVISAVLYMICSMILMVNMLGYFLGHYRSHFNLTEAQRTLILQTFLFFIWLAGGAGMFQSVETRYGTTGASWTFSDGLYFCDVTILTVGFGDLTPSDNIGRGLVLPYSVGGIIMLGLMVSSISTFAGEISKTNVIKKRLETSRAHTMEKAQEAEALERSQSRQWRKSITEAFNRRRSSVDGNSRPSTDGRRNSAVQARPPTSPMPGERGSVIFALQRTATVMLKAAPVPRNRKQSRLHLLREEKDRFDAMRHIQWKSNRFKRWSALTMSFIVLGILWCVGAVVFWQTEQYVQGMSYFEAWYFCFVSLLTIGYGDFAPKSNAGRPFFVVWSILAVPSITILIGDLGDTVISSFKNSTNSLADFTLLPKHGVWRKFLENHPWLLWKLQKRQQEKDVEKRLAEGFPVGPADGETDFKLQPATIESLAKEEYQKPSVFDLGKRLAAAIQATIRDLNTPLKRYSYEEWVQFTQLIRFTSPEGEGEAEEMEGLIEWDWIGEDSPMMTDQSEPEWVLDRLCESMARFVRQHARHAEQKLANTGDEIRSVGLKIPDWSSPRRRE